MTEQFIIMLLVFVILSIMTVMYIIERKDHKADKAAWDAERTDLLNRIAAKSIGEYERLKSSHMPRDEPHIQTAHDKAINEWRFKNAIRTGNGIQGGNTNQT